MLIISCLIFFLIMPVNSFSISFQIDGLWEEYGNEELSLMFENGDISSMLQSAGQLGFDLSWILTKDSLGMRNISVDYNDQEKFFGLDRFRITSRNTGDNLDRQAIIAGLDIYDRYRFNFVNENDPGENWNDFQTFNLSYKNNDYQILFGSMSAGFGEGLVLWRGFDWGGYAENPISPKKADFLRGYSSTGENSALFGGGIRYTNDRLDIILIYSDRKLDAREEDDQIVSLQSSGIHVSESEKANEDNLREALTAGHLNVSLSDNFSIGVSGSQSNFSPGFAKPDSITDTFGFSGEVLNVIGSNVKLSADRFYLTGEYAETDKGGKAVKGNLFFQQDKIKTLISVRKLSEDFKNFRSLYPDGNETGYTFGAAMPFWQDGSVNVFYESWQREWRTSTWEMPPEGNEGSLCFSKTILDNQYSIRLRHTENNPEFGGTARDQIRLNITRKYESKAFLFRFETIQSNSDSDIYTGYLTTCAFEFKFLRNRAKVSLSGFTVPDYDCRIYRYEYDIPGIMSVPFFIGDGVDLNIYYNYQISKSLQFAFKTSITSYFDRPDNLSQETDKRFSIYLDYNFRNN